MVAVTSSRQTSRFSSHDLGSVHTPLLRQIHSTLPEERVAVPVRAAPAGSDVSDRL